MNQRTRISRNEICRNLQGAQEAIVSDVDALVYAFRAVAGEQSGANRMAVDAGETPGRQQDVQDREASAQ